MQTTINILTPLLPRYWNSLTLKVPHPLSCTFPGFGEGRRLGFSFVHFLLAIGYLCFHCYFWCLHYEFSFLPSLVLDDLISAKIANLWPCCSILVYSNTNSNTYRKFPKYSDTQIICCNHSKIWTIWLCHRVMSPNDADGMANSVDPDQTAPQSDLGLHYLPRPVCPKT